MLQTAGPGESLEPIRNDGLLPSALEVAAWLGWVFVVWHACSGPCRVKLCLFFLVGFPYCRCHQDCGGGCADDPACTQLQAERSIMFPHNRNGTPHAIIHPSEGLKDSHSGDLDVLPKTLTCGASVLLFVSVEPSFEDVPPFAQLA